MSPGHRLANDVGKGVDDAVVAPSCSGLELTGRADIGTFGTVGVKALGTGGAGGGCAVGGGGLGIAGGDSSLTSVAKEEEPL